MPHLRCTACGVVSWTSARVAGEPCPECGVPRPRRPEEVVSSPDAERRLTTLVGIARDLLDADVALLTEIDGEHERVRVAVGELPGSGSLAGASLPLGETYCRLLLDGEISGVVGDTRADARLRDLIPTTRFGVGAYLGVPIDVSDARSYVLCCLAREARPALGTREIRLLSGLAESVRAELTSA